MALKTSDVSQSQNKWASQDRLAPRVDRVHTAELHAQQCDKRQAGDFIAQLFKMMSKLKSRARRGSARL